MANWYKRNRPYLKAILAHAENGEWERACAIISTAFVWSESPQGEVYWATVANAFYERAAELHAADEHPLKCVPIRKVD